MNYFFRMGNFTDNFLGQTHETFVVEQVDDWQLKKQVFVGLFLILEFGSFSITESYSE